MASEAGSVAGRLAHGAVEAGLEVSKLGLGPLMILQGRRLRGSILRLPEPPGERAGGPERSDSPGLLFVGDSAMAAVGVAQLGEGFAGQLLTRLSAGGEAAPRWEMWAQSGLRTQQVAQLVGARLPGRFEVAITSVGVNDVTSGKGPGIWMRRCEALRRVLRERHGVKQVLMIAVPPMHRFPALPQPLRGFMGARALSYNAALRRWCAEREDVHCLEIPRPYTPEMIAEDGFHPAGPVCEALAERAAPRVRRWLSQTSAPTRSAEDLSVRG